MFPSGFTLNSISSTSIRSRSGGTIPRHSHFHAGQRLHQRPAYLPAAPLRRGRRFDRSIRQGVPEDLGASVGTGVGVMSDATGDVAQGPLSGRAALPATRVTGTLDTRQAVLGSTRYRVRFRGAFRPCRQMRVAREEPQGWRASLALRLSAARARRAVKCTRRKNRKAGERALRYVSWAIAAPPVPLKCCACDSR